MFVDCYRLVCVTQNGLLEIYKPLEKNKHVGYVFDTLANFPKGTHLQVIKKFFWKTYKIDIDRLPVWLQLDQKLLHEDEVKYWYNKMFYETSTI